MARINYGDKEPGDLFTADMADEIATVVNALGTAADVNTGTAAGNVPVLGTDGKLPAAILPEVILGEGTGDVTGPASSTDGLPALFDGNTGKAIKAGTAGQLVPTDGTEGDYLRQGASAPEMVAIGQIVTDLDALTGEDRLNWEAVKGLSSSGAGELYAQALIAYLSLSAGDVIIVNDAGDDLEGLGPEPEAPAPGTASSSSGSITLNYTDLDAITTTTTENITAITITADSIPLYGRVAWIVTFGGAHSIEWPATWWTPGTIAGANATTVHIVIYRAASTVYHINVGATLTEEA